MTYRTVKENIALVHDKTTKYQEWYECIHDAMVHAGMDNAPQPYFLKQSAFEDTCKDVLLAKIYWLLVEKESQP